MSKKITFFSLIIVFAITAVAAAWYVDEAHQKKGRELYDPYKASKPEIPVDSNQPIDLVPARLSEEEAKNIAESECIKGGEALGPGTYNENTHTWWFDANLNTVKEGCNPACVVDEKTKTVEINWRCTGAIPPDSKGEITDFDECVAAGNAVMETYPRQCSADGKNFVEQIKKVMTCSEESRKIDVCAEILAPVCATVEVKCVKAPCPPIKQTFSNACQACMNQETKNYTEGECE
ncbi:MAG TPA: hypothetical protein P5080_00140 [Candidatus Paceibacterota bacterium]|nr:hypothetical protein [Candidatus Pacearchaeota archaeon]HRZ50383.1 hypothetical protein [Candidatus Paceibacterota bacterium]HSA36104.1 hypothetical protein [Candidatus Paceibacterota bacterium]